MKSNSMNKAEAAPAQVEQHTPGPWQYEGSMNGKDLTVARVFDDNSKTNLAVNGGRGYVCTIHTRETGFCIKGTEAEANACLIAAAPETAAERDRLREINAELLQALQRVYNNAQSRLFNSDTSAGHPDFDALYCICQEARAAIAKAEGKL